ncbi:MULTISPECIES: glycosyltransferase [unclassified Flavobacterium]|uniref:glycosyltransferase n=1 Tax=unclassified Flavobacterium TaxID=196869 RepID=UPI003F8DAFC4
MPNAVRSKIVFLSTFPPTECGIATFTKDLIAALSNGFGESIEPLLCNLTTKPASANVDFVLNPHLKEDYIKVAQEINKDSLIKLVHIQHEFGLYGGKYGAYLLAFLATIRKPVTITFHSVIPQPDVALKRFVEQLTSYATSVIVMTNKSRDTLVTNYSITKNKIICIPHGTHIVDFVEPAEIKQKFNLENRIVLSTFGLLGPGKCIETALKALPDIILHNPNVVYLIIGKTHPNLIIDQKDDYRDFLESLVDKYQLNDHVIFIDNYLENKELLSYLQATDIYLFTSKDPNQAVSGTFTYALSCGCPIVASSIAHTREILTKDTGILYDIEQSDQLAKAVKKIMSDDELRKNMALNAYKKTRESSWENVAVKHLYAYQKIIDELNRIQYNIPPINLNYIKKITNSVGVIHSCKVTKPDKISGYTLEDNARALIAAGMHYNLNREEIDLDYLCTYLHFLERCQKDSGKFRNYVNEHFDESFHLSHLDWEESNAHAVWALGYIISLKSILPHSIIKKATLCIQKCFIWINKLEKPRAIGFAIKGLYLYHLGTQEKHVISTGETLANKMLLEYERNILKNWKWFENYMSYANSILPESILYIYLLTKNVRYKNIAESSFKFLLSKVFVNGKLKSLSKESVENKKNITTEIKDQPIAISYVIQTLNTFYRGLKKEEYKIKIESSFSWYLGRNHLNQIIYNPVTGGCYDGLEKSQINLNQGAASSVSYLIARLELEENNRANVVAANNNQQLYCEAKANASPDQLLHFKRASFKKLIYRE